MHVLVFRHIAMEHLGLIAAALDRGGIEYRYHDLFERPADHLSLEDAAGIISLGGPMSVNDDLGYIRREIGLLEFALAVGKPILGICLGCQLIAKALGARVFRNPVKEIGWALVERTDAGRIDPLLASFRDPETVLHWHGETFDLPTGATLLAQSENCANQAFRFGPNVYGLQFHLEATADMVAAWSRAGVNAADVSELDAPPDPAANQQRMRELSAACFGAWVDLLGEAGSAATAG
ncbi:MAG: glutamine amidotransferase [bacterium]|nr:glutamine amidotransferase [bacterium]